MIRTLTLLFYRFVPVIVRVHYVLYDATLDEVARIVFLTPGALAAKVIAAAAGTPNFSPVKIAS